MIGNITQEALERLGFEATWCEWIDGEEHPQFVRIIPRGTVCFSVVTNGLYIWSGLGMPEDYGYEIKVFDLSHLESILKVIGGINDI